MTRIVVNGVAQDVPPAFAGTDQSDGELLYRRYRDARGKMRRTLLGSAAPISIYTNYTLAENFTLPKYWVGGTQYGQAEGPELNGDPSFDNNAYWAKGAGWAVSGGNAVGTATNDFIYRSGAALSPGLVFNYSFTISGRTAGSVRLFIGNAAAFVDASVNGIYTGSFVVNSGTDFGFFGAGGFTGNIESLSLKLAPGAQQLPGYSYTGSGARGFVDASGAVQFFATGVTPNNSAGYHAYGALTNSVLQSQTFENASWVAFGAATFVSANSTVAPDGTTTADTINFTASATDQYYQTISGPLGFGSMSIFAKVASGTKAFRLKANVNGLDTASPEFTATTTWQRFTFVHDSGATFPHGQFSILNNAGATAGNLIVWGANMLAGNFPDGGPIITTTTAAVGIGASVFSTSPPSMPNVDCMLWKTFTPQDIGTDHYGFDMANAGVTERILIYLAGPAGIPRGYVVTGGAAIYDQSITASTAGVKITILLRRLSGSWRVGKIVAGVLTWGTSTAGAMPTGMTKLTVGSDQAGTSQSNGAITGMFVKQATYATDADVLAAVAETA